MPSTQYWDVWTKVPFGFTTWAHRPLGVMTYSLAYRTGVPWNEAKWFEPRVRQAADPGRGSPRGRGSGRKVMAKLEAMLLDDGPIVAADLAPWFTFFDKRVQGFALHPTGYINVKDLADLGVEEARATHRFLFPSPRPCGRGSG